MKKHLFCLSIGLLFLACSSDDSARQRNPNFAELNFSRPYNLTLPQYNQLNFAGNSLQDYSIGVSGINIFYIGNDQYFVFELTDPNHPVRDCSRLTVEGLTASCQCEDGNEYNLTTGEQTAGEPGQFALVRYQAILNGDVLTISN